jgi:hypothetical protein
MTEDKNLKLAKNIYQRYDRLMNTSLALGSDDFRNANANLSMWFTTVEQILKLNSVGKENTK